MSAHAGRIPILMSRRVDATDFRLAAVGRYYWKRLHGARA